jgi:hypothetical protein
MSIQRLLQEVREKEKEMSNRDCTHEKIKKGEKKSPHQINLLLSPISHLKNFMSYSD